MDQQRPPAPARAAATLSRAETRSGLIHAAGAYLAWGLLPVYWKALGKVPALDILCNRIVWSLAFLILVLTLRGRWGEVRALLAARTSLVLLAASGACLAVNWFLYIWAVNASHVVEASLGYYINPLVNALFGLAFFRERLRSLQVLAIALATLGVANQILHLGHFPWIALALAVTFGLYGLIRKVVTVEPMVGLLVETAVIGLPAALYLGHLAAGGEGAMGHTDPVTTGLLVCAGVITTLPLSWFAYGARRLRLTTLGVMQYTAPTCMFLLGVLVYREPFSLPQLVTFALIWGGVALYTADGLLLAHRHHRAVHQAEA